MTPIQTRTISLVILIINLQILCGCTSRGISVGDKLPNLVFCDLNGNKVRVYDYIQPEKVLLLHFWGAACCLTYSVPTTKAVANIDAIKQFDWVTVVSINLDYPLPRVRRIVKELRLTHRMLTDKYSNYYRAEPKLQFFFPLALILAVDDKGIIRGRLKGPQLEPAIQELVITSRDQRDMN